MGRSYSADTTESKLRLGVFLKEQNVLLIIQKDSHVIRLDEKSLEVSITHGLRSSLESAVESHSHLRKTVGWMLRFAFPEHIELKDIAEVRLDSKGVLQITKKASIGTRTIHIPELSPDETRQLMVTLKKALDPVHRLPMHRSLARSLRSGFDRIEWMLILVALVGVWEIGHQVLNVTDFPSPSSIAFTWIDSMKAGDNLAVKMIISYRNLFLGLLISLSAAIPAGFAVGLREKFELTLTPLMMLFAALPDLAILPIIVYWTGHGVVAAILMIAIASFFPMFFTIRDGVRSISSDHFEVIKILGANKFSILREVVFPASWPSIITGFRLAFSYCWQIILAIEMIAMVPGIGLFIKESIMTEAPRFDQAFAAIFTVGIAVLATDRLVFARLEAMAGKWRR